MSDTFEPFDPVLVTPSQAYVPPQSITAPPTPKDIVQLARLSIAQANPTAAQYIANSLVEPCLAWLVLNRSKIEREKYEANTPKREIPFLGMKPDRGLRDKATVGFR